MTHHRPKHHSAGDLTSGLQTTCALSRWCTKWQIVAALGIDLQAFWTADHCRPEPMSAGIVGTSVPSHQVATRRHNERQTTGELGDSTQAR